MKIKQINPPWNKKVYKRKYEPFYHTQRWRDVRKAFLLGTTTLEDGRLVPNSMCLECYKKGKMVASNTVDHIHRIKDGGDPYDHSNFQALCRTCHDKKSSKEGQEAKLKMKFKNP
jgi:5-methylcytosine-specific restriction protein A